MERVKLGRSVQITLLALGFVMLLLRFFYLGADFPSHSLWEDDAARFTDEGWYAGAAIHKTLQGHWLLLGDFNPGVTIPAWPLLLRGLFVLTGVSITAARAVEAVFCVLLIVGGACLARRHLSKGWTVVLFTVLCFSPTLFVYSHLALLEIPMLACFVAAVLMAPQPGQTRIWRVVLSALLFLLSLLIKSNALFLLPALLLYVWSTNRKRGVLTAFGLAFSLGTLIVALYGGFFLIMMHTHAMDFQVLARENGMALRSDSLYKGLRILYRGCTWASPLYFFMAIVSVLGSLTFFRSLWKQPLFLLSVGWIVGFSLYMVLHYAADPRYFVPFVLPATLLSVLLCDAVLERYPAAARPMAGAFVLYSLLEIAYVGWILHAPTYRFRDAAAQMAATMRADHTHRLLVVGHGAIETTFFTKVDAIDDIGSLTLGSKLERYQPGWIVTWNYGQAITQNPQVTSRYNVVAAGQWDVLDEHLFLYRLDKKQVPSE